MIAISPHDDTLEVSQIRLENRDSHFNIARLTLEIILSCELSSREKIIVTSYKIILYIN